MDREQANRSGLGGRVVEGEKERKTSRTQTTVWRLQGEGWVTAEEGMGDKWKKYNKKLHRKNKLFCKTQI